jgi:hypothetical protein
MYKQYENVSETELEELEVLSKEVKFQKAEGYRRRGGVNGPNALSRYNVAKWFDWTHAQRELYRIKFPAPIQSKILQGWFLEIPRGTGFLDLMDAWVGKPLSGTVIATALKNQSIHLDHKEVKVKKGQQIGFNLQTLHELKPSKDGQLWACVMILGCPLKLTD